MSEPNLKAMTQAELLKYLEDDFMPRLLPKLANFQNLEAENARLKAEVERLRHRSESLREAGDELWFCLRHGKRLTHAEVQEAVEDWQSAREAE